MDYNNMLQRVGSFGKFQKIALFLLAIPIVFDALTTMMLNFIFGKQLHRCRVPGEDDNVYSTLFLNSVNQTSDTTLVSSNLSSNTIAYNSSQCSYTMNGTEISCNDWIYDETVYTSTLTSKFNMVCADTIMRSHVLLSHFIGSLLSTLTCGLMCDTWGRKPTLAVAIACLVVPNVIRPWIPNLFLIGVCEVFNALGSNTSYFAALIMGTELVGPSYRVLVSFILYFSYCLGEFILLIYAYFIRDWEILIVAISAPIATSFFIFIFITESPRWLLATGRVKEAVNIFQKTAKCNKMHYADLKPGDIGFKEDKRISVVAGLKEMLKLKKMRLRCAILTFNWFSISLIYYGISFNVGEFGGNVYINYAVSTIAETVAILLCFFADRFPRKKLLCFCMITGGVACLSTILTSIFADKSLHWITVCLAMIGKLGVTASFFLVPIITSEIFPTTIRVTAFSICNTGARIGSIASSYIGKLGAIMDTKFDMALPLVIFGSVGTAAGIVALWLPETRNIKLPQTLHDALNIDSESSDNNKCEETVSMIEIEPRNSKL